MKDNTLGALPLRTMWAVCFREVCVWREGLAILFDCLSENSSYMTWQECAAWAFTAIASKIQLCQFIYMDLLLPQEIKHNSSLLPEASYLNSQKTKALNKALDSGIVHTLFQRKLWLVDEGALCHSSKSNTQTVPRCLHLSLWVEV